MLDRDRSAELYDDPLYVIHGRQEQIEETLQVDEVAAIFNPNSIDAIRAFRRFEGSVALPITQVHTVAGGALPNTDIIRKHGELLGPQTLLAVIGGDGLAHVATNAMALVGREEPRINETKRLFINGGTAGDTAKSLNRPNMLAHPDRIIRNGWLRNIYPMEMLIEFPDGEQEIMQALGYNSVGGFTGLAAEYINLPTHRDRWLNRYRPTKRLAQFATGMQALKNAQPVEMTIDGETRQTLDVHCLSGPIMATIQHRSTELTEPGFHVVENTHAGVAYLASQALRLQHGGLIDKTDPLKTELSVITHAATVLQAGGETWRIPAETSITVSPGDPIAAVTTRPELRL